MVDGGVLGLGLVGEGMSKGVFFGFSVEELGLGLGLGFGQGESLGVLPGEKKVVIWLCLRTRGERPLLERRREGPIGALFSVSVR